MDRRATECVKRGAAEARTFARCATAQAPSGQRGACFVTTAMVDGSSVGVRDSAAGCHLRPTTHATTFASSCLRIIFSVQ